MVISVDQKTEAFEKETPENVTDGHAHGLIATKSEKQIQEVVMKTRFSVKRGNSSNVKK